MNEEKKFKASIGDIENLESTLWRINLDHRNYGYFQMNGQPLQNYLTNECLEYLYKTFNLDSTWILSNFETVNQLVDFLRLRDTDYEYILKHNTSKFRSQVWDILKRNVPSEEFFFALDPYTCIDYDKNFNITIRTKLENIFDRVGFLGTEDEKEFIDYDFDSVLREYLENGTYEHEVGKPMKTTDIVWNKSDIQKTIENVLENYTTVREDFKLKVNHISINKDLELLIDFSFHEIEDKTFNDKQGIFDDICIELRELLKVSLVDKEGNEKHFSQVVQEGKDIWDYRDLIYGFNFD